MIGRPKVGAYKITKNPLHNNFLIHPEYIHQEYLIFSYQDSDGKNTYKIIPVMDLAPYIKLRRFYRYDDEARYAIFRGIAYELSEEFVLSYREQ